MRIKLRACAVLAALVALAGTSATVKEVKVRAVDNFGADISDVLSFCSVQPGATFSQEAVSRDVRTLLDTGRYGYASVELSQTEEGLIVTYVVQRRYRFQEPLQIKGADFLSERKIRKLTELSSGDYIDEPVLAAKVSKVRDEYVKRFFPDIQIGIEINPIEDSVGAAHVALNIEEGARARIRQFQFTGNPSIPEKELRAAFDDRDWWDPRGWFTDTPVSAQDLEDARQKVEEVYHNQGYLDARVAPATRQRVSDKKVDMLFEVTEGDIYYVESKSIRGVKLFPEQEVLATSARVNIDDVAGHETLEKAAKDIRDYYGSRGYIDTYVRPIKEVVPGRPGRIAVTFEVKEGELCHIRNILIRGNNATKDKVIRREILVEPGELMDEPRIERSENRLKNLNYFKVVRHYTEPTTEPGTRDLVYEVEEQRTGNIMVGVGFSSIDYLVGFFEVTQSNFDILNWPNFTGGGQRARLGVEYGQRRQTAEVSWTEPWFLDRPLALTVEAYRRLRWFDQYDEVRSGASVGLSYPVKLGRVGVRYTLELVEMDDVSKGDWDIKNVKDGDTFDFKDYTNTDSYFKWQEYLYDGNINSAIRLFWAHDTRDQPFVPTRGYQTMVYGELFEGGIGDNEIYKMGANYKRWLPMPWYKHVLSLRGRFDTVEAYQGDVPIYERFFLGGPRTVRGVEYRDIGPKVFREIDRKRHAPIGGQTLALVTAEYSVPLFKAVRAATFMDIGSLGKDSFDPELSDVCVSVGIGLRIDIPGFPIRFDVAKPIVDDDSYTDHEFFSFSIGFE